MNQEQHIINLIECDSLRMRALRTVKSLDLPDWLIAAGFVRNLVWSNLFGNDAPLNDIDVIYYCALDVSQERDSILEQRLHSLDPELPWSVKNQARMHLNNGDAPYTNTLDAMGYWPEKQTAIGATLDANDEVVLRHRFDLNFQFNGKIDRNPARSIGVFSARVAAKGWLELWPELQVNI
ncbi:MAG: nucleotidyltransferase family protein [Cellvibrionaceae bacterium]